jgi:hypothetical protein
MRKLSVTHATGPGPVPAAGLGTAARAPIAVAARTTALATAARTTAAIATAAVATAVIIGCGDTRARPPDPALPLKPRHMQTFAYPAAGVTFRAPSNWITTAGQAPLVATSSSGRATVAIWRYPRTEPLPSTPVALAAARDALVAAARARDPHLKVIRAKLTRWHGAEAISLAALELIAGRRRRVRSLHVFTLGEELVIDAYAPPSEFHDVDRLVFSPLGRSLRIHRARSA